MISYDHYPMPPDWEKKYDFATKKYFFVNHKTKTTTWEDPRKKVFESNKANINFINRSDFMEDSSDLNTIIQELNKEDNLDVFLKKFKGKYPSISDETLKEVFKKSKGNYSNAEVLLRQETRKETDSSLSKSTINYRSREYDGKNKDETESRFRLSERSKYAAPETSKDRIKFKLRQEFCDVDIRIVDRVLEITDFSLEESRKILLKTNPESKKKSDENAAELELKKKTVNPFPREIERKPTSAVSDIKPYMNFKNFVSRRSKVVPDKEIVDDSPEKTRRSLAAGANPKNFKGPKVLNEY